MGKFSELDLHWWEEEVLEDLEYELLKMAVKEKKKNATVEV